MKHEIYHAPKAVILADGVGSWRHPSTVNSPTALSLVGGSALIERMIRNCLSYGISQFVVVLGDEADALKDLVDKAFRGIRVTYVINDKYRDTNTGYSLMLASPAIAGSDFIIFNADVAFDSRILGHLLDSDRSDILCIDRSIACADDAAKVIADDGMRVLEMGRLVDPNTASGVFIGIDKISAKTGSLLFSKLSRMLENTTHAQGRYDDAYVGLLENGTLFHTLDVTGMGWIAIKAAKDLAAANAMFGSPITTISRGQQRQMNETTAREKLTL